MSLDTGRSNAMDLSKMSEADRAGVRMEWAQAAAQASGDSSGGLAPVPSSEPEEKRACLPEDVALELVGAPGPITLADIQEGVNARPGPYVAGGPIEAELDNYAAMTPPRVRKIPGEGKDSPSRWEATAELRAELDTPAKIVDRLAAILLVFVLETFVYLKSAETTENGPNQGTALFADEVLDVLEGKKLVESVVDVPRVDIPKDVMDMDLTALAKAGVLVKRPAADEIRRRDEEEEGDADERETDWLEHECDAYSLAPGALREHIKTVVRAAVTPLVPGATPLSDAKRIEAEVKAAADRTEFERKAAERFEEERKARLQADAHLNAVRRLLDSKGIGHLFNDAVAPLVPAPKPSRQVIQHIVTEKLDDAALARMFVEVAQIDDGIKEHRARIEGAKLSASATEKEAKSRISELEERKRLLQSLRHGDERTYEVEAYASIVTTSSGPVRVVRAVVDDRELFRETMTPAQAFADSASASPTPKEEPKLPSYPPGPTDETRADDPKVDPAVDEDVTPAREVPEPKVSVELSVKGLRPFVLQAAALSGGAGLSKEELVLGACNLAHIKDPSASVKAMVSGAVRSASSAGFLEQRDDSYTFSIRDQVLTRVKHAGDSGLHIEALTKSLTAETGADFSKEPCNEFVAAAIEYLVDSEVLSRGAVQGASSDLLWVFGQTDPRQLSLPQANAPEEHETTKQGRGRKRGSKAKS